jgi:L-rhamnose isomerase/sugar isomerase
MPDVRYMIDASHNLKDPIEDLIQATDRIQCTIAQALLVDRASLAGGSLGQALAFEAAAYRGVRDGVLRLLETLPGADALPAHDASGAPVTARRWSTSAARTPSPAG